MEMFERDVQHILDAYLEDEIDEAEFLEKSRSWPNYAEDYRPLIEFSKVKDLPVLAANIPRKYASMLRKEGWEAIENLPGEERIFIAEELVVLDNEYKQRFFDVMTSSMGSHGGMQDLEGFYQAQCIKDDTMAESIASFIRQNPGYRLIHYNGDFHSRSHLGTAQKLQMMMPELKITVISPVRITEDQTVSFSEEYREAGDFLIIMK
jgi:uncharacterized iron-regulated protein